MDDFEEIKQWDRLSPQEQKQLKRKLQIMYYQQFSKECGYLQYVLWFCLLGLMADAGYKAMCGGDWLTPLLCLAWLIGFGLLTYIFAILG